MGDVILVTGGAGYVGSHLARKLLDSGHHVRILDGFWYGHHGLEEILDHPNLELIDGDIRDQVTLAAAAKGAKGVVALAAIVGDAACDLNPQETMEINYEATRHTLRACQAAGVQRLVFASSCSVYGANGRELLHENSHLNPVSLYARTRIMSEELLLREAGDLEIVILRLATVCGVSPRMRFDLMVNTMTACAAKQGTIRISGAKQWRPHLHVKDAAEAFKLAVEAPNLKREIFNVGSDGQNFTVGEIAEKVAAHLPRVELQYLPNGSDARSYRVSFERIESTLGFRGNQTVDDAIVEVSKLLETGAIPDYTDEVFYNSKWLSTTRNQSQRQSA
jgi:nucleoside-diphosphate-sugar epimerase